MKAESSTVHPSAKEPTRAPAYPRKANFLMAEGQALMVWDGGGPAQVVCPNFSIVGQIVDSAGRNPGYLLKFTSLLQKTQHVDLPIAILNSHEKTFNHLTMAGFEIPLNKVKERVAAIRMYLEDYCPSESMYIRVTTDGWMTSPDGHLVYVYGEHVYGARSRSVQAFRTPTTDAERSSMGNKHEWLALLDTVGNDPMPVLVICAALSSVLLSPFGMSSMLLFLVGPSSIGKTILLKLASSVFDAPNSLVTWEGTDNGIEAVALHRKDKPLIIDEVGQSSGRQFASLSYRLTNAAGKLRATPNGQAATQRQTSSVVISAGEVAPLDIVEAAGIHPKQGQMARLVDVPVEMEHGVWGELGDHSDGAEKSHKILQGIERVHGIAGRQFCKVVAKSVRQHKALFDAVEQDFVLEVCPDLHECADDSVPSRVCRNFALFAFAGLLAIEHEIVPWSDKQVLDSMRVAYGRWIENYRKRQPKVADSLLLPVRLFLESQRGSKFKPLDTWQIDHEGTVAGFEYRKRDGEEYFLIYPAFFSGHLCGDQPAALVLDALKAGGYLRTGSRGVPTVQVHMPGSAKGVKRSFYAVSKRILLS